MILEGNYWIQFVPVKVGKRKWLIGGVYHSPSASDKTFLEKLEDFLVENSAGNNKMQTSNKSYEYVITNVENVKANVHHSPKINDHSIISVALNNKDINGNIVDTIKYRNLNEDNLFAIKTRLLDVDWVFNDVNVNSLMNNMYDNCE
ncbi:hypothetical protein JTB14_013033 [Gonioctena quinquepunctata]|nr:hypothetical protein JTB14_013033 [Gonioctena quinquepunctata]